MSFTLADFWNGFGPMSSHEVAVINAADGASTARQASADSLHCSAAFGSVIVSDHFRCTGILGGISLMKLEASQHPVSQSTAAVIKPCGLEASEPGR